MLQDTPRLVNHEQSGLIALIESENVRIFFFLALWLTQGLILGVPFKEQFKDLALTIITREVKLVNSSRCSQLMFMVEVRRAFQCTYTATHFGFPLKTTSDMDLTYQTWLRPFLRKTKM